MTYKKKKPHSGKCLNIGELHEYVNGEYKDNNKTTKMFGKKINSCPECRRRYYIVLGEWKETKISPGKLTL